MDNNTWNPISVETFAAFLDGNLDEFEMSDMDNRISADPTMDELMSMSDIVDEDVMRYTNDEFTYETDMELLENSDFEIPNLDDVLVDNLGNNVSGEFEEAADTENLPNGDSVELFKDNPNVADPFKDDTIDLFRHDYIENYDPFDSNHHSINENIFEES